MSDKQRRVDMNNTLKEMLSDWHDPLGAHTMSDAEDLIHALEVELSGKEAVIAALHEDIKYYRKDWKDQMIQDQGRAQIDRRNR